MFPPSLTSLPQLFRARGTELEGYSVSAHVPWTEAAQLLEQLLTTLEREPLDLETVSQLGGYTVGHLRRLLGLEPGYDVVIPNAGTPEDPRILRCHIPRKPGHGIPDSCLGVAPVLHSAASSRMRVARAVASED
jgi:hypothetical protein